MYHYLDGAEKKGPFTEDELLDLNITEETLIYSDSLGSWKKIKEVKNIYDKYILKYKDDSIEIPVTTKTKKLKAFYNWIIPIISTIILATVLSLVFTNRSIEKINQEKQVDYKKFLSEVEFILQGHEAIMDYIKSKPVGDLSQKEVSDSLTLDHYECSGGGFSIAVIAKEGDEYVLKTFTSKNMVFVTPEYFKRKDYDLLDEYSYSDLMIPTNRGSVEDAYNGAFDYLIKQQDNVQLQRGNYRKIISFDEIETKFYETYDLNEEINESIERSHQYFNDFPYTKFPYVYNDSWFVWYTEKTSRFHIVTKKDTYDKLVKESKNKSILLASLISALIFLIFLLIRRRFN